jgi:hypothetical protein
MCRPLAQRLFAIVVVLAVLGFITAALAHGHPPGKSEEDSHCALCMAVHNGHHMLTSPVIALQFTPVRSDFIVVNAQVTVSSSQFLPTHGRAPPLV